MSEYEFEDMDEVMEAYEGEWGPEWQAAAAQVLAEGEQEAQAQQIVEALADPESQGAVLQHFGIELQEDEDEDPRLAEIAAAIERVEIAAGRELSRAEQARLADTVQGDEIPDLAAAHAEQLASRDAKEVRMERMAEAGDEVIERQQAEGAFSAGYEA
jgi:hypothetical protein